MLELYQSYADYTDMMAITEEIFEQAAMEANGTTVVSWEGHEINLTRPWPRLKVLDALKQYAGLDVMSMSDDDLKKEMSRCGAAVKGDYIRGLAIDALFAALVEEKLVGPVLITHQPVETTPLCKPDRETNASYNDLNCS
jgi:lysyl-tRNA synthetase class 2